MSGIFGLIQRDHTPVARKHLQNMQGAMADWGQDKMHIIIDQNAGFGHLLTFNTPESVYERLPTKTLAAQLFTAAARLDNRDELCDLFQIPVADRATLSDSAIIWQAYEKWGEDCPDRLLGDWAFALWDPVKQRLFLARDHHGNTALYFAHNRNRFAFASSRKALLALGIPRRLDELYLAQVLISWPAFHGPGTIDRDIYRLPPAHALFATPERVHSWRYWYLEDTSPLRFPTFREYVEGFTEVFTAAVRCRLRCYGPLGATLSGGLDSGSVTALAARELQKDGKSLTAFTAIPLFDTSESVDAGRFGDETTYAQLTGNAYSNINHYLVDAAEINPLAGLRQMLAIRGEPGHAGGNYYWLLALFKAARQNQINSLLTGQGGNATISWTGAPGLRSPMQMIRHRGWKKTLKVFLPGPLLRAYQLSRIDHNLWNGSAIYGEFANKLDLAQRRIELESKRRSASYRWRTPFDMRLSIIKPGHSIAGVMWAEIGAAFGIEVRDPTFDKRVLAYTLSVPDHIFGGHKEQDRRLIRDSMKGILPDEIRLNPKRGRQAGDIGFRIRNCAQEVSEVLKLLQGSQAASYLDIEKMRICFKNVLNKVNVEHTNKAGTVLMRGLDAGLFLNE